MLDLLARQEWGLFAGVFSEGHCAGHHLWHLHDESSAWHPADPPAELRNGLLDVYRGLDEGLARILAAAGSDTSVLAVFSAGIGPITGGWQLLPEVLVRLGYGSGGRVSSGVRGRLPESVKRVARGALRSRVRERLQERAGSLPAPLASPRARAAAVPNSPLGAVRLNVRGRDPFGSVAPGAEYDEIARELTALVNPSTGTPAIESVARTDERFATVHPNIPDLVVRVDRTRGPIEAVRSARVGTVSAPIRTAALPRTGDHLPHVEAWALGPAADGVSAVGEVLDVGSYALRLLGVERS